MKPHSFLIVFLIVLLILTSVFSGWQTNFISSVKANPDWLNGWSYRVQIDIDSGDVDSALSSFPVLIHLSNDSSGIYDEDVSFIFDEVTSNSKKIAFTVGEDTETYVEIESWDASSEVAYLWANVTANDSTNTTLYLYYDSTQDDNTDYVDDIDTGNAVNVWDANFDAVWHLEESASTSKDSKGSTDLTWAGTTQRVSGQVAGAHNYDGNSDYESKTTNPYAFGSDFTIECYMKADLLTQTNRYIWQQFHVSEGQNAFLWEFVNNNVEFFSGGYSGTDPRTGSQISVTDTTWHHIAYRKSGTTWAGYKDGTQIFSVTRTFSLPTASSNFVLGSANGANYFDGSLDEFRISTPARSEDWIEVTYETMIDDLLDFGSEETAPAPDNSVTLNSPNNGVTETSWNVNFNYTPTWYDTPKNACIQIFNSSDNELVSTVWNTSALINASANNQESYTFSIEQSYKWHGKYFNTSEDSWPSSGNYTLTVDVPPRYQNVDSNSSAIEEEGTILLYGQGYDGIGLDWAWLWTNETNDPTGKNYTETGDITEAVLVDEPSNPTREPDDGWEDGEVNEQCDFYYNGLYISWYRGDSGTDSAIGFENSTDGITWVAYENNPILTVTGGVAYAYVVQDGDCFYLFAVKLSDGELYLWNVTNHKSPSIMNGGSSVLEATVGWEDGDIQNVGVTIDSEDTWHMLYECPQKEIGYTHSTLALMDWTSNKSANNPLFTSSGNPYLTYVTDRDSILCLIGETNPTYWELHARCANLSDNLDLVASWYDVPDARFLIDASSIHVADPCMMSNFNATYPLMISYNHAQTNINQTYCNLTLNQFYDVLATGTSSGEETYNSPMDMGDVADTWTWSNFTWTNSSISSGTIIQWQIYYNDTYGNVNGTGTHQFSIGVETTENLYGEIATQMTINRLNTWSFNRYTPINPTFTVNSIKIASQSLLASITETFGIASEKTASLNLFSVIAEQFSINNLRTRTLSRQATVNPTFTVNSQRAESFSLMSLLSETFNVGSQKTMGLTKQSALASSFSINSGNAWTFGLYSTVSPSFSVASIVESLRTLGFSGTIASAFAVNSGKTVNFGLYKTVTPSFTVDSLFEYVSGTTLNFYGVVSPSFTVDHKPAWTLKRWLTSGFTFQIDSLASSVTVTPSGTGPLSGLLVYFITGSGQARVANVTVAIFERFDNVHITDLVTNVDGVAEAIMDQGDYRYVAKKGGEQVQGTFLLLGDDTIYIDIMPKAWFYYLDIPKVIGASILVGLVGYGLFRVGKLLRKRKKRAKAPRKPKRHEIKKPNRKRLSMEKFPHV